MNLCAAAVILAEACFLLIAWMSPDILRSLAARCMTRADVLESMKVAHRESLKKWRQELGCVAKAENPLGEPRL